MVLYRLHSFPIFLSALLLYMYISAASQWWWCRSCDCQESLHHLNMLLCLFCRVTLSDLFCVQFNQLLWTCRNIDCFIIIIIITIIIFIVIIPNNLRQINGARLHWIPLFVIIYFQNMFWTCSICIYVCMWSVPDGVIGIFHWHNPPDRTVALGSTQPLTEMSTRSISCG